MRELARAVMMIAEWAASKTEHNSRVETKESRLNPRTSA
jgi:hypothetical protein